MRFAVTAIAFVLLAVGSAAQLHAQAPGTAFVGLDVPVQLQGLSPGSYDSFEITCTANTRVAPNKYVFGTATRTISDSFNGTVTVPLYVTSTQVGEVWDYSCQLLLHVGATGKSIPMSNSFAIGGQLQGFIRGTFTI